jgi:glycosyltransferase involved in cell wall biosynthesis
VVEGQRQQGHEIFLFGPLLNESPGSSSTFDAEMVCTSGTVEDLMLHATTHKLDVLHTHTVIELHGRIAANGVPLIRTMHGHEAYCPSGTRYLAFPVARPCPRAYHITGCTWGHLVNHCGSVRPSKMLDDFRRVELERRSSSQFPAIAVSEFVRAEMVRNGYEASLVRVILNPAPEHAAVESRPYKGPPRLLALGRLVSEKGFDWLLKSVARLTVPYRLAIAGTGPQETALRRRAAKLHVTDKVTWLGWLSEDRVAHEMAAATCVVVPSVWHEPAGLVLGEAAAASRPVVAANVGGIPEYAALLGNALLVEPNDVDALTQALSRVIEDRGFARNLGDRGRANSQQGQLTLRRHVVQLTAAYQQTIERHRLTALGP